MGQSYEFGEVFADVPSIELATGWHMSCAHEGCKAECGIYNPNMIPREALFLKTAPLGWIPNAGAPGYVTTHLCPEHADDIDGTKLDGLIVVSQITRKHLMKFHYDEEEKKVKVEVL